MRVSERRSATAAAAGILGIAVVFSAMATPPRSAGELSQTASAISPRIAQEIALTVDPARSKVNWSVDSTLHAVHGTFALKSGALRFDPSSGKAGGEFVVFATSGDSGNSSRDGKMHKEVLESAKYSDAVFRPSQIDGKVASSGGSDVSLHGTFFLHGTPHEIVVPVHAELNGDSWKGTGKFDVPYVQWGLKNPSNFLLKVQPIVTVELELAGSLAAAPKNQK